jgi:hypothetical protein
MGFLGLKPDQQSAKFVFPGKRPFDRNAQRIDDLIPEAWTATFGRLWRAVAGILLDVRPQTGIENL